MPAARVQAVWRRQTRVVQAPFQATKINAQADSSGLGKQWLDGRQDCQLRLTGTAQLPMPTAGPVATVRRSQRDTVWSVRSARSLSFHDD